MKVEDLNQHITEILSEEVSYENMASSFNFEDILSWVSDEHYETDFNVCMWVIYS